MTQLDMCNKVEFQAHYISTYLLMISFYLLEQQIYAISLTIIQTTLRDLKYNMQNILKDLPYDMQNILKWFKANSVKPSPNKFQFMIFGKSTR